MAKQDYYETLGVDREVDDKALKSAFRKLAMQYHPDRNPDNADAESKFKEINEAYEILKDAEKRAAYDRYGHAAFEQGGPGGGGGGFGGGGFSGFGDIFEEMFGDMMGGGRGQSSGRGADLRYNMEISLEDAYNGKKATIEVPTSVNCDSCEGTGSEGGKPPSMCPSCHGRGKVRAQQGFFTIERTCPTCHGAGSVISDPCGVCGGTGRERKSKNLSVSVPAGVEDGTRIRLTGEGEAGLRGAPSGDLYIFLSVAPHRIFQREGANIFCEVPIPMTTAALGGEIEVPTVDGGRARIKIPEGTQGGNQFRLRSKGMSVMRSAARGDMFVEVSVETPVKLTKEQKDILKQFEAAGGGNVEKHSPETQGFFSKVKDFFEDLTE
ncbi:chaperone Hsp40, co-chaperone with DnaK [Candidatus Terasakiella magnetica]|uniref:Chaperone protein DnaJ n=1 Tax=Candidatus Terasakiella magnetica TaxID=1867952 RepID=A0A1C3RGI3_9PROT|nr:molecular chaperone DnaJ [Candidatus Terasakiella magnetica]SCA56400.1 chaperone Hsp40, co-chaperone with DnaK [Candidatus Terasakiella magnetica]